MKKTALLFVVFSCLISTKSIVNAYELTTADASLGYKSAVKGTSSFKDKVPKGVIDGKRTFHIVPYYIEKGEFFFLGKNLGGRFFTPLSISFYNKTKKEKKRKEKEAIFHDYLQQVKKSYNLSLLVDAKNAYKTLDYGALWCMKFGHNSNWQKSYEIPFFSERKNGEKSQGVAGDWDVVLPIFLYGVADDSAKNPPSIVALEQVGKVYFVPVNKPSYTTEGGKLVSNLWVSEQQIRNLMPSIGKSPSTTPFSIIPQRIGNALLSMNVI
jgi:hypothetical protein